MEKAYIYKAESAKTSENELAILYEKNHFAIQIDYQTEYGELQATLILAQFSAVTAP